MSLSNRRWSIQSCMLCVCGRHFLRKLTDNETGHNTVTGIQNGDIAIILLLPSLDPLKSDRSTQQCRPCHLQLLRLHPHSSLDAVVIIKIRDSCCDTTSITSGITTTAVSGTGLGYLDANPIPVQSSWTKLLERE